MPADRDLRALLGELREEEDPHALLQLEHELLAVVEAAEDARYLIEMPDEEYELGRALDALAAKLTEVLQ